MGMYSVCPFFYFAKQTLMSQSQTPQKPLPQTGVKQQPLLTEEDDLSSYGENFILDEEGDEDDNLDIQSTYLHRLRIQRKRIEELSAHLIAIREKYEQEVSRSQSLENKLEKMVKEQISVVKYEEISVQYEEVSRENDELRECVDSLKREIYSIATEGKERQAKMIAEFTAIRRKDQGKIEQLQDQLSDRDEALEKVKLLLKQKEKQIAEITDSSNARFLKFKEEQEEKVTVITRRLEKQQQDKAERVSVKSFEGDIQSALREKARAEEERYKFERMMKERQAELQGQIQRYRAKIMSLKRDLKLREKEAEQLRSRASKIERESKQQNTETEQLRVQVTRVREEFQTIISRKQNDFSVQRRNLRSEVERHTKSIEQLLKIKDELLGRVRYLEGVLQKKRLMEKKRSSFLKDEMREIDRLEKVIDKIVE